MVNIMELIDDYSNLGLPEDARSLVNHTIYQSLVSHKSLELNLSSEREAQELVIGLEKIMCIWTRKRKAATNPNKKSKYVKGLEKARELLELVIVDNHCLPSEFSLLLGRENKFDYGIALVESYSKSVVKFGYRVSTLVTNAVDRDFQHWLENVDIPAGMDEDIPIA